MGLGLAEPGFATAAYVEWEEYPRSTLIAGQRAGYLHPAPIWDNVKTFSGRPWRGIVDTILAGYPCQPFSQAGQRKGADDPRHLWPDVARIIREVQPEWVFLENVAGHITLGLEAVLRELWAMGWTPAVGAFSAAETGAPHERLRVFIVAHRNGNVAGPDDRQPDAGADGRHDIGRSGGDAMADTGCSEREGQQRGQHHARRRQVKDGYSALSGRAGLFPPGPGDAAAWADALTTAPDLAPATGIADCIAWAGRMAQAMDGQEQAAAQSDLCRMADGLASRSRALRLLGNGVHPLAAAYAWRTLAASHGLGAVDLDANYRDAADGAGEFV